MKKIPENIITIIRSFLPLIIIIVLFFVVGSFGFGKISELRDQINTAQTDQLTLTQKLEVLRNVSVNGADMSNLAVSALPDANPSLTVISQIKNLATSQNLLLTNIKAGDPGTDATGLSIVSVGFNVAGSRQQVESFINSISTFAPLTNVASIKLSEDALGMATAILSVKSYWAAFPTKIPAVTDPVTDLTPDEKQIMQNLGSLTQPVFIQLPPAENGGRSDPFSL